MSIKLKKIIYWTRTIIVTAIFTGSAMAKLVTSEQSQQMAKQLSGEANIMVLGALEIIIAFLWLMPRTGLLATILGVSYLGGAIAVHFVNNQPYIVPVIIQIILFIAAFYRFPELWQRFIYNVETSDIDSIL